MLREGTALPRLSDRSRELPLPAGRNRVCFASERQHRCARSRWSSFGHARTWRFQTARRAIQGEVKALVVPNARRDRFRTGFQHPRPHAPWSNASSDAQPSDPGAPASSLALGTGWILGACGASAWSPCCGSADAPAGPPRKSRGSVRGGCPQRSSGDQRHRRLRPGDLQQCPSAGPHQSAARLRHAD